MNDTPPNSTARDPRNLRQQLDDALQQPELSEFTQNPTPSEEACRAACIVAWALGQCRVSGIDPGQGLDRMLPAARALGALRWLVGEAEQGLRELERLPDRYDQADPPFELHAVCCGPLEHRMDAWMAVQALDESYLACLERDDPLCDTLAEAWDVLADRTAQWDEALIQSAEYLCIAADTRLLDNWRTRLTAGHWPLLPWWLDGTLEQTRDQIAADAVRAMPSAAAWSRVRQTAGQSEQPTPARRRIDRLAPPLEPATMAAATTDEKAPTQTPDNDVFGWRSPGGDMTQSAQIILSKQGHPAEMAVRLVFRRAGRPCCQGQSVLLAGLTAEVDENGMVVFRYGDLVEAHDRTGKMDLLVDGVLWTRTDD